MQCEPPPYCSWSRLPGSGLRRYLRLECVSKIRRTLTARSISASSAAGQGLGVGGQKGDTKCFVGPKRIDQPAAFCGVGTIEQPHGDGPHIDGDHIAEHKQLDQRGNKQQGTVFFIPEKLDKFLSHQFSYPKPGQFTFPPVSS